MRRGRIIADAFTALSRPRFKDKPAHFHKVPQRAPDAQGLLSQVTVQSLMQSRRANPGVALLEAEEMIEQALAPLAADTALAMNTVTTGDALAQQQAADDDVFVHEDDEAVAVDSAGTPNAVPKELADLVTDEFAEMRKREVERRRKILYDLMTPKPEDYQYNGKLVPVPPISFGVLTPEAHLLGKHMFTSAPYRLVRQAKATEYFFEINDLYIEVVFVGRANAGKSSLINAVSGSQVAKTSSLPNSTRTVNFYQNASQDEIDSFTRGNPNNLVKLPAGGKQFTLVDVPGFGIEGMSDRWRDNAIDLTDAYLGLRRSVNTVFMCVDAVTGLTPTDLQYFEWLSRLHGIMYVVVTKADAVSHTRLCDVMTKIYKTITAQRRKHRNIYPFVLPVSAHTGDNIDQLRALIVETSGMIPGNKMREIMRKKSHEALRRLAEREAERMKRNEIEEAARQGKITGGVASLPTEPPVNTPPSPPAFTIDFSARDDNMDQRVRHPKSGFIKGHAGLLPTMQIGGGDEAGASDSAKKNLWNAQDPTLAAVATAMSSQAAAGKRRIAPKPAHLKRGERGGQVRLSGTSVLVEQPDGSFVGTSNGHAIAAEGIVKRHGVTRINGLSKPDPLATRAKQRVDAACRSLPVAKPAATLKKGRDKYAAGHGLTQERFWDEVDAAKVDTDGRRVSNVRRAKEWEFAHGSRISWGSQPKGALKHYGKPPQAKTRASSVLGLDQAPERR